MIPRMFATLAAALLLQGVALPAAAQPEVPRPADPWVHASTGASFPSRVGQFTRARVIEYSSDGHDASVGYRTGDGGTTITVYLYPASPEWTCQQTFADVLAAIERYQGSRKLSEGRVPPPSGAGAPTAFRARYLIPAGAMAQGIPEVLSEAYLHCPAGGTWRVKYRATWPSNEDHGRDVESLIRDLRLPAAIAN